MGVMDLSRRRIIALCLLVVSFFVLFCPWITISVGSMGVEYSVPEVIDILCAEFDMSREELENELRSFIENSCEVAEMGGIRINPDRAMRIVHSLMDGSMSPFEAATICSFVSEVLSEVKADLTSVEGIEGIGAGKAIEMAQSPIVTATVSLWVLLVILCASFGYALYTLLKDKKYGVLAYVGAVGIVFIVFAVVVNKVNSFIPSIAKDILSLVGLNSIGSGLLKLNLCRLTIFPYICLVTAVFAAVAGKADSIAEKKPIEIFHTGRWTCSCGVSNGSKNRFCYSCGRKSTPTSAYEHTPASIAAFETDPDLKPVSRVKTRSEPKVEKRSPVESLDTLDPVGDFKGDAPARIGWQNLGDVDFTLDSSSEAEFDATPRPRSSLKTGPKSRSAPDRKAICPHCGARQSEDAVKCKYCGTPMR